MVGGGWNYRGSLLKSCVRCEIKRTIHLGWVEGDTRNLEKYQDMFYDLENYLQLLT